MMYLGVKPIIVLRLFLVIKMILSHYCKTFLPSYLSGRVCVKLASFLSARVLEVICEGFRNINSIYRWKVMCVV